MADDSKLQNSRDRKPLTQARIRRLFHYDPDEGILRWRVNRGKVRAGSIAGCVTKRGRIHLKVDYKDYFAHQIIWCYVTGEFIEMIDHRDLNQANNRWNNLREATCSNNHANKRKPKSKHEQASPLKGAQRDKTGKRWMSRIACHRKRYFLGLFDTDEEAHEAYVKKARELFGEFARAA